ncbi:MAG: H-type lectin domain-containing protein [Rhodobacterales bacterium]
MKRIYASIIGIDQGSELLFSDFDTGGEMWVGKGDRDCRVPIVFSEAFNHAPSVMVTLEMFDMDQRTNQRAETVVENVTRTGCDIVFKTWGDTKVARARASWMAIGGVKAEDDWE